MENKDFQIQAVIPSKKLPSPLTYKPSLQSSLISDDTIINLT